MAMLQNKDIKKIIVGTFFNEDHHGYWNGTIDGKIATF